MKGKFVQFVAGIIIGAALVPTTYAAVQQLTATPSTQRFYVDGAPVQLEAYAINGNNYVKLRDVGEAPPTASTSESSPPPSRTQAPAT